MKSGRINRQVDVENITQEIKRRNVLANHLGLSLSLKLSKFGMIRNVIVTDGRQPSHVCRHVSLESE